MRRWLILFLLSLLPLQVSWAVAATVDYCAHDQGQTTQHFGHHEDVNVHDHDARAPGADKSHGDTGQLHLDHEHNHLSGFLGLLSEVDISAHKSPQFFPRRDALIYLSLPPGNLERPNWRHLV